jgi:hypothetical protein
MDVADCIRSPTGSLSLVAGGLLAFAYGLFGDALLLHHVHDVEPPLSLAHWAPSILAMIAFCMLLMTPVHALADDENVTNATHCARLWLFCTFIMFFGAIIAAVFMLELMRSAAVSPYAYISTRRLDAAANITTTLATYDDVAGEWYHLYVGYVLIVETVLIFASGATCFMARVQRAEAEQRG